MQKKYVILSFSIVTGIYISALIFTDYHSQVFDNISKLFTILPALFGLAFISYFIRYIRWYRLLRRIGNRIPFLRGYVAYLTGFAFTATPGKLGELVRIKYFRALNIPPWQIFSLFLYERTLDLVVVLCFSLLFISDIKLLSFAISFVVILLIILAVLIWNNRWLVWWVKLFRRRKWYKLAQFCLSLQRGVAGCRVWITFTDLIVSCALGFVAWGLVIMAFLILLHSLKIYISIGPAISVYPLAMLVGAGSMLPGGIGTTEATIVALLLLLGVALEHAMLAAIGIRLASMWFAIICGFISVVIMEVYLSKHITGNFLQKESPDV